MKHQAKWGSAEASYALHESLNSQEFQPDINQIRLLADYRAIQKFTHDAYADAMAICRRHEHYRISCNDIFDTWTFVFTN